MFRVLFLMLVLCLPCWSQLTTVTVTGTVLDPSGNPYAGGSGRVLLVSGNGSGTQNWLVNSTNPVSTTIVIYGLDSFGHFSQSITKTSAITPSSAQPQWRFQFCASDGVTCFTMNPLSITVDQDISAQIQAQSAFLPLSTSGCGPGNCVVRSPSLSQTIVQPVGTSFNINILNNIPFADQFAGSDACVKITAAIASLPAAGGIVDARGFTGDQFCLGSNTIAVGSATKGVHLILGNVTLHVQNAINIFQGSSIIGIGSNGTMSTILKAGNAFPVSTPMIQMQTATVADSMLLRDFMIDMNAVPGSNGIDMGKAQDQTEVNGVYVLNSVGSCLTAINASVQQVKITRFDCTMATTTGAVTAVDLGSGGGLNDNFYLSDIGITSQSVTQLANDIRCNACNMHLSSAHLENSVNGILFQTATSGASFVDNLSGLSNLTNVVNIDATFTGSVSLFALRKLSATNTVANALAAFGCGDEYLGAYVFSTGTTPPQLLTTCSNGGTQLYTSRQITSTVATGTAPGSWASTTVNTNFNADMLDGFHAGNASTGKAMCWKDATHMGYCSTQPDAGGACTCN